MTEDQAEVIALQTLSFLAADETERDRFLNQTGMSLEDIKDRATDSDFLGAVLDFLLSDEQRVMACCEHFDWPPELPTKARHQLPGATAGIWM